MSEVIERLSLEVLIVDLSLGISHQIEVSLKAVILIFLLEKRAGKGVNFSIHKLNLFQSTVTGWFRNG